jgi:hypothetical protein
MSSVRVRRTPRQRLPITITLEPSKYAFVEACAREHRFKSVDDFFDAALAIFRNHMQALNAYIEIEESKGASFEEILRSAQCEIVFTRGAEEEE